MSKIVEQARAMAKQVRFEDSEHIPNTDVFKESADLIDALAAEVEKLEEYKARHYVAITERDALREKLACAQTANSLLDKALLVAHPQGAEGVVYEYWNEARKFMEATK